MHGYNHIYGQKTYKKDYFRYGGRSEFYGEPLHIQLEKINKGLEIFKKIKSILDLFLLQIILMMKTHLWL